MARSFAEGINQFQRDMGGGGSVSSRCLVSQVYAAYQHESLELRHPRGGQAKYLEEPLLASADHYMQRIARDLITDGGSELQSAMIAISEDMVELVEDYAPREWHDLMYSGAPSVIETSYRLSKVVGAGSEFYTREGHVLYERAPKVRRLTDEELRAKHEAVPFILGESPPRARRKNRSA